MPPSADRESIKNLTEINAELKKQNSLSRIFLVGIIYGVGFLIGSAIIATIILGIVGPIILSKFPGIGRTFFIGLQYLQR